MKKITLSLFALLTSISMFAQDTCADAVEVTAGTYSVAAIDGTEVPDPLCYALNGPGAEMGEWYIYNSTIDGMVTVETSSNGGSDDTRIHVYTGSCSDLECIGGNDDISSSSYFSSTTFPVEPGETYYIAFDDRWNAGGFDFTISESTEETCEETLPYDVDWANVGPFSSSCYNALDLDQDGVLWGYNAGNDLDGDGTDDAIALVFPPEGDDGAKDDWLISPALELTAGTTYTISFTYNAIDFATTANESFEVAMLESYTAIENPEVLGTYSDITQSGSLGTTSFIDDAYTNDVTFTPTEDGTYYVGFHATSDAPASIFALLDYSIEVGGDASIDNLSMFDFNYRMNNQTGELSLSANTALDNLQLFNVLGQNVLDRELSNNEEKIQVSNLTSGVYIAKVEIDGRVASFKFIKK